MNARIQECRYTKYNIEVDFCHFNWRIQLLKQTKLTMFNVTLAGISLFSACLELKAVDTIGTCTSKYLLS